MLEVYKIKFNPLTDIGEVQPNLALDITNALMTGQIKGNAHPLEYSKETNTGEVGNYLRDTIDMLQAQKNLNASMKAEVAAKAAPANPTPQGE